jgi:hypothetical protein
MRDPTVALEELDRLLRRLMTAITPRGALPDRDPEYTWQALEALEAGLGRDLLTDNLLARSVDFADIEAAYRVLDARRAARRG